MTASRHHLPDDWFPRGISDRVTWGADVYLDSSYGFDGVVAGAPDAVHLGDATGAYDRAALHVGPSGRVVVGAYTVLNGCTLVCNAQITIGDHCLLAWGAVLTDSWDHRASVASRASTLRTAAQHPERWLAPPATPQPIVLEDNVWIGFDAVVLPGTRIGRGAVVSSRSVVQGEIPPYAVVVGNPGRVVRLLDADDTAEAREAAFHRHLRPEFQR